MSTKHVFGTADGLVERALHGVAATNPNLRCYGPAKVVYDASWSARTHGSIALVSGGGAGHEPGYAGYVGKGMLAAAVSGEVFASPSTRQIGTALDLLLVAGTGTGTESGRSAAHPRKVIFVVLQYSGDALHFGLAKEKASQAGWDAEVVLVGDDVSVGRAQGARVGRRGLAAQVFVIKAMGAWLLRHPSIEVGALAEFGRRVGRYAATMGLSLDHCHPPGIDGGEADWRPLGPRQVGLGVGIHNEPGVRLLELSSGGEEGSGGGSESGRSLIKTLLRFLLDTEDEDRAYLDYTSSERMVLVVNNLGGISVLELNAVAHEALSLLESEWKVRPERVFVGTYLSSLNAPGFSLSLINLDRIAADTEDARDALDILEALEAPTEAVGWTGSRSSAREAAGRDAPSADETFSKAAHLPGTLTTTSAAAPRPAAADDDPESTRRVQRMLRSAARALIAAEPEITRLDTLQGDGDCGTTLRSLARGIEAALPAALPPSPSPSPSGQSASGAGVRARDSDGRALGAGSAADVVADVAGIVEDTMGGTSGALYALFLRALAARLQDASREAAAAAAAAAAGWTETARWAGACQAALESLFQFTLARPGDRTLVDALEPFVRTLADGAGLERAVRAAREGAEATGGMVARLGRAAYVGESGSGSGSGAREKEKEGERLADPGAIGVAALLEGLLAGTKGGSE